MLTVPNTGTVRAKIEPGYQLQGYQLGNLLGSGGMADVYLALKVAQMTDGEGGAIHQKVAIKVMKPWLSDFDPSYLERFVREARIGASVQSDHVVRTLDAGRDIHTGQLFIVMELVDGCTLKALLLELKERGLGLPISLSLQICCEVLEGLDDISRRPEFLSSPLVHRDIKPSNILLTRKGGAKLADLGLVRPSTHDDLTLNSDVVVRGTPRYMSPEQAHGTSRLDVRSDLFSVGLVLFELLALQPLYEGEGETSGLLEVAKRARVLPRLEMLPALEHRERLKGILTQALAREPDARFPSPEAFESALREVQERCRERYKFVSWAQQVRLGVLASSQGTQGEGSNPSLKSTSQKGGDDEATVDPKMLLRQEQSQSRPRVDTSRPEMLVPPRNEPTRDASRSSGQPASGHELLEPSPKESRPGETPLGDRHKDARIGAQTTELEAVRPVRAPTPNAVQPQELLSLFAIQGESKSSTGIPGVTAPLATPSPPPSNTAAKQSPPVTALPPPERESRHRQGEGPGVAQPPPVRRPEAAGDASARPAAPTPDVRIEVPKETVSTGPAQPDNSRIVTAVVCAALCLVMAVCYLMLWKSYTVSLKAEGDWLVTNAKVSVDGGPMEPVPPSMRLLLLTNHQLVFTAADLSEERIELAAFQDYGASLEVYFRKP